MQWIILLGGLLFAALPSALHAVGGWSGLREALPAGPRPALGGHLDSARIEGAGILPGDLVAALRDPQQLCLDLADPDADRGRSTRPTSFRSAFLS